MCPIVDIQAATNIIVHSFFSNDKHLLIDLFVQYGITLLTTQPPTAPIIVPTPVSISK